MKRIHKLFIVALLVVATSLILSGCYTPDEEFDNELHLSWSAELVAAKVESSDYVSGHISGTYLLGFGGISGNINTSTTKIYNYWYKREDGGIIPDTINMTSYECPEYVTIVIYEDDSVTPKVEIWRNHWAEKYGDGEAGMAPPIITEIRFTIPTGSFVNTYDLQGLTENSQ